MKNKQTLLLFFGVGILLIALFGFLQTLGINVLSLVKPAENIRVNTSGKIFTGSVKELLARGGNYACTWETTQNKIPSSGTVFLSNKNLAASARIKVSGFNIDAHVVGDGNKFYVWTSLPGSKGTSINYTELEKTAKSVSPQTELLKQKLNFMCSSWMPDESKFSLPTEIDF